MAIILIVSSVLLAVLVAFLLRVVFLLYTIFTTDCSINNDTTLRTIFCIGSGGHTMEMLRLEQSLNSDKYKPRLYIIADNDISSEIKIHEAEMGQQNYSLSRIPRSRNVKQAYHSSIASTLYATLCTIPIIYNFKPHLIFCNGPGTCVPVCVVAFILRSMFLLDCRIVFIESVCRVRTLSLTGKILQCFADIFVVQWPQLRDVCFRAKYFGRLT